MSVAVIEDAMIAEIKTALGKTVREVSALPGRLDLMMLKQLGRKSPGVYVSWLGGQAGNSRDARINGVWDVYFITAHASGQEERRRGSARMIGAYNMAENVVPVLHGYVVPDEGMLMLRQVVNLYSGDLEGVGVVLYAATFHMDMAFPLPDPTLDDFMTFDVEYDMAAPDSQIDAVDELPMEQ